MLFACFSKKTFSCAVGWFTPYRLLLTGKTVQILIFFFFYSWPLLYFFTPWMPVRTKCASSFFFSQGRKYCFCFLQLFLPLTIMLTWCKRVYKTVKTYASSLPFTCFPKLSRGFTCLIVHRAKQTWGFYVHCGSPSLALVGNLSLLVINCIIWLLWDQFRCFNGC